MEGGMKNWLFSTTYNVALFENDRRYGCSYNGRRV